MPHTVPDPRDVRHPGHPHIGRRVLLFPELPSTNDHAAALAADPANAGTVVVADFQTRGRGQYGRVWQSRPGASLLMSVLLFPPPELRRPVVLTAWAAVSVAGAITELTGADARIKWPNDLLVGGKKVCGILIEQGAGTVVGIGLNLNQSAAEFADAGLPDATSLAVIAGRVIDPDAALAAVLWHLDAEYGRLAERDVTGLESAWQQRVGLLDQPVTVELADGTTVTGRLLEQAFDGLAVEDAGEVRLLTPEAVRHVRAAFGSDAA